MAGDRVVEAVTAAILRRKATLATAESCTGGLIAHRLTNVPGSSEYYLGGIVSYSNAAKEALLEVPHEILTANGAVSEPVARAMAEGAQRAFGASHAIGVTGIAGPGGGSAEKPVGLVYIAVASPTDVVVQRNTFEGSRESIKQQSADAAMRLLTEQLQ